MIRKEKEWSSIRLSKKATLHVRFYLHSFVLSQILHDSNCMKVINLDLIFEESPKKILYELNVVSALVLVSEELKYDPNLHEDGDKDIIHLWGVAQKIVEIMTEDNFIKILEYTKSDVGESCYEIVSK